MPEVLEVQPLPPLAVTRVVAMMPLFLGQHQRRICRPSVDMADMEELSVVTLVVELHIASVVKG